MKLAFFNKRILSLLTAGFFALSNAKGVAELITEGDTLVSNAKVNMRLTNDLNGLRLGAIPKNKEVLRLYSCDNDWSLVSYNKHLAFVKNEFFDDLDTENRLENISFTECDSMMVTTDDVRLRLGPGKEYQTIRSVPQRTTVKIVASTSNNWYLAVYQNQLGFISGEYLNLYDEEMNREVEYFTDNGVIDSVVLGAKVINNNVNIYAGKSSNSEVIGFADMTDLFEVVEDADNWYRIKYLNMYGYIAKSDVLLTNVNFSPLQGVKEVYLIQDSPFYLDLTNKTYVMLPKYQNATVLEENDSYYRVMIDGVVGYLLKKNTRVLTDTCVVIDLGRQILKVYQLGKEVARFHVITGRQSLQTELGCFNIGHKLRNYQLTKENFVEYWIQYNHNEGMHDASWQKKKNFEAVAQVAYTNFINGDAKLYPYKFGSHGCDNMEKKAVQIVYEIVSVGDNVLVIGPNDLLNYGLLNAFYFHPVESNEYVLRKK